MLTDRPDRYIFVTWGWIFLGVCGCQYSGSMQNNEGVRLFQQGQPQAAVSRFQQSIVQNPSNPDAYYNLAASYHYKGRTNREPDLLRQAEGLYHQCLDLHPNHVACHRGLAVLLVDSDRPQSAFTLLRRWSDRSPYLADAKIELARLHQEFDEIDSAKRYLTEAIDINPQESRAWAALGQIRERQGQFAQAINNYEQAYRLNNFQPGVANRIASLRSHLASRSGNTRLAREPNTWRRQ